MPLPVPEDTLRVRFTANLVDTSGTPRDIAQFGFWGVRLAHTGGTTDWPNDVTFMAEAFRDSWNTNMASVKGRFAASVHMDTCVVDHLQASDGTILDQGVATFSGDDAFNGGGDFSMPWETSLVVSLFGYTPGEFAAHKGRKRGRMYLPPLAPALLDNTEGFVGSTHMTALNTAIGAFFQDVQGKEFPTPPLGGDPFLLAVISRGTVAKPLPPTATPIILVQIDNKIDSQRRRERQEDATVVSQTEITLPTPP